MTRKRRQGSLFAQKSKVVVEGINIMKRTLRPTQENPSGGFVERSLIHVSNLMVSIIIKS